MLVPLTAYVLKLPPYLSMGVFPIPFQFCLDEFSHYRSDTLFKCVSTGSIFINDLRAFMASESNANWWKDYVYAIGSEATCGTEVRAENCERFCTPSQSILYVRLFHVS